MKTSVFGRFLPGARAGGETVYLVCTSAGEVGVNISADHLVCDLSTFESMAQRLGLVNRFGEREDTRIDIFHPREFDRGDEIEIRREKTLGLSRSLDGDGSPDALGGLDPGRRLAAFSPPPPSCRRRTSSSTPGREHRPREVPGRPPVEPYLHGAGRRSRRRRSPGGRKSASSSVSCGIGIRRGTSSPITRSSRTSCSRTGATASSSTSRPAAANSGKNSKSPAWLLDEDGTVQYVTLKDLADKDRKERLHGRTVLLPPSVGGLNGGLLDGTRDVADDVANEWLDEDLKPRRARVWDDEPAPPGMRLVRTIDTRSDPEEDDDITPAADADEAPADDGGLAPGKEGREGKQAARRIWCWYASPRSSDDAARTSPEPVPWGVHTRDVAENARRIVEKLAIPEGLKEAVVLAAEFHDRDSSLNTTTG
ncbi:MAG: type I-U CRISPR-associated helicase/endonuclease Cas3, partial [Singulisphaera sp.]